MRYRRFPTERRNEALLIEVPQLTANDLFLELEVLSLLVSQRMTTAAVPILLGLRLHVSFFPTGAPMTESKCRSVPTAIDSCSMSLGRVGQRLRK
jgi:hypothetical protein